MLFSRLVMSNSLGPHALQHARLPCPSPSPGACSSLCPLSHWCHPAISSSVVSISSCPQFFPASGSFPESQLFTSGWQSIGASVSASVLPVNIQGWFPLELTRLISLLSKGLLGVFSSTTVWKHKFFGAQPKLEKPELWLYTLLLARFVIAFLSRSIFSFHGCSHHLQWFWSLRK